MSAASDSLLRLRDGALSHLQEGEPGWIGRLREEALATFEEQGFPTRRLEDWKGTNLAKLEATSFGEIGDVEPSPVVVRGDGVPELHFVDGRLNTANSQAAHLPPGVRLMSMAEARRQAPEVLEGRLAGLASPKRQAMVALQTAFLDDGAVLMLEPGIELESPIRLLFSANSGSLDGPSAFFPRILILASERSRATVYIENTSSAAGLTALVSEVYVGAGAHVECIQVQNEGADRTHFTSVHARVERGARFDSHVFSLSPGTIRSELEVTLAEPGAETKMRGFYLGRDKGHVDHFTTVDHAAASCSSDEEYRGVLGDESDGVFRGLVIVRPDAQKTEARQSNPNLLLSKQASVDSKPQLEIYADDVRASHGSTTGQLDADALFFLRARGISARNARLLLTRAFAQQIVDGLQDEAIRESVSSQTDTALAALGGSTE